MLVAQASPLVVFFRSLATMLGAGVTVHRGVGLLARQSEDPRMARTCEELARRLQEGSPLSNAMARSQAFSAYDQALVAVGESTGSLHRSLEELAAYHERQLAVSNRVRSTLIYPAFLLVACSVLLVVIPPFLLEGVLQVIASSKVEPPLLTRGLIALSAAVRSPLLWVLGSAAVAVLVGILRRPTRSRAALRMARHLPLLGGLLEHLALGRFARSLALQLHSGALMLDALGLSARTATDPMLESAVAQALKRLKAGECLSRSLDQAAFPAPFRALVSVGEEAGEMPRMLNLAGEFHEQELEVRLQTLTSLLEPFIMLAMGLVVGLMLLATMLPLAQALEAL